MISMGYDKSCPLASALHFMLIVNLSEGEKVHAGQKKQNWKTDVEE